jgi:hypothetical protein
MNDEGGYEMEIDFWTAYKMHTPASEFYTPIVQPLRKEIRKENKMEDVIVKHLGSQESQLIHKLVTAVEKGNVDGMSRRDFEMALEAAATSMQRENPALSPVKAYNAMLQTETGQRLYDGYVHAQN